MTNIRLPNAPSSSLPAQPDRGSGRMPSASSARRSQAGLCLTPAPVVKYWPEMMARPIWGAYPLDFPGGLVVQTQCLHCRAWVWFLVREVRSLRPCTAKKKETFKSNEHVWASQVVPVIKSLPANAGDGRDTGLSLGQEDRAPGGRHGTPLQYSCLENLRDTGAGWATVHGVAKSRTRLKRLSTHISFSTYFFFINIGLLINNSYLFSVLKVWMSPVTDFYRFFCSSIF